MVEILGWVAAFFGVASALPQILHLVRTRTSEGVSLLMWQLNLGVILAWTTHGLLTARVNLIVVNGIVSIMSAVIVWLICKDRRQNPLRAYGLPLLVGVVLFGVELGFGPFAFGLLAVVPAAIANGAQFKDLLERPDLSGVSVGTLLMLGLVQATWFVWSVLANDVAVTVSASVLTVVCVANIVVYGLRRTGTLKARAAK